jgi:translation initiation factor IF-2
MKNRRIKMGNQEVKTEMDQVINELEKRGITKDSFRSNKEVEEGLGDVVESVLTSFGITEERFKTWFGLKECNCSKRKKWLNNIFSWKRNNT